MIYDYFFYISCGYSVYKNVSYMLNIKHDIDKIYDYYYYLSIIPKYIYKITFSSKK